MVLGGILIAGISMSILTGYSGDPEKDIVGTWYFDCESVSDPPKRKRPCAAGTHLSG